MSWNNIANKSDFLKAYPKTELSGDLLNTVIYLTEDTIWMFSTVDEHLISVYDRKAQKPLFMCKCITDDPEAFRMFLNQFDDKSPALLEFLDKQKKGLNYSV